MARARGGRVELLGERKEIVGVPWHPATGQRADARRSEARQRQAGASGRRRRAFLGHTARNVRAGSNELRFFAAIRARPAPRETGDVTGVVSGFICKRATVI